MPVLGTLVTCRRCQTPILPALQTSHQCGYGQRRGVGDRRCRDCGAMVPADKRRGHKQTTECRQARRRADLRKKGLVPLTWELTRELSRAPYAISFDYYDTLLSQRIGPAWLELMHLMITDTSGSREQIARSLGLDYDTTTIWDLLAAAYQAGGPTGRQKTLLLAYKLRAAREGSA